MIVIPLRIQPQYEELRYCLRAIEKYHPEQEILLVGAKPDWGKMMYHISHYDNPNHERKAQNIYNKILLAFEFTDKLLFFNDDHIILSPVNYLHHKGPIDLSTRQSNGTYTALLRNTLKVFPGANDYDTHCPIYYEKEKFNKLSILDWDKPHGYGIKTSYVYLNKLQGEFYPDLKFRQTIGNIEGRLYFSTDDCTNLIPLKIIFPNKSRFEK